MIARACIRLLIQLTWVALIAVLIYVASIAFAVLVIACVLLLSKRALNRKAQS